MSLTADARSLGLGFVDNPVGTHTYRSIAVDEFRKLVAATKPCATYQEIRRLALDENVLSKATQGSREKTLRILREFYALRPEVPVYSALRFFWDHDEREQPLLAFLCACARDPVLRESATVVLPWPIATPFPKSAVEDVLRSAYPGRYSPDVIQRMTRNLLSSWTQSGHLWGHRVKIRSRAFSGPASTAYAFFLGHLAGERGNALFDTLWVKVLDAPQEEVHENAFEASKLGWIDYRNAGGVIDIAFHGILAELVDATGVSD